MSRFAATLQVSIFDATVCFQLRINPALIDWAISEFLVQLVRVARNIRFTDLLESLNDYDQYSFRGRTSAVDVS
jgi:hypothetical protein